jgi:hypothetical protein
MRRFFFIVSILMATGGAYLLGRARAAGVPGSGALFYSGYLTDSSGKPDAATHTFIVKLFADSTAGAPLCTVTATQPVTSGRFRLQLDDTCTAAVHANPDLFLELTVDAQVFARSKLGAVPYALEAASAAAVPLANLTGVTATAAWPGAVSPDRVLPGTTAGWVRTAEVNGAGLYAAQISGTAVAGSSGAWVSSVGHGGTGSYDVFFVANIFSAAPTCVAVADFGAAIAAIRNDPTASSIHVAITDSAGSAIDEPFNILCMGR